MITDKATILASIAANGLRQTGKNKWVDNDHEYSIRRVGSNYTVRCARVTPSRGMNTDMRDALRPIFLASRSK